MQASAPRPEAAAAAPTPLPASASRPRPFQWNLLAWAALVGVLTGLAIVGFHLLLNIINNFLYGPFVEGLLDVARSPGSLVAELPRLDLPTLDADAATPLKSLLDLGLEGIGLSGLAPRSPSASPTPLPATPDWLALWPVVVVPTLGGLAVGLLRWLGGSLGPGLPTLMAMADGSVPAAPKLPLLHLVAASLSLGSGASLGPEGPSIASGGNLGLWVARRGGLSPEASRALVAAGVAAGLAAGFKAPIAGVFFAFEGSFSTTPGRSSLRAVLVAAVASALVTQLCLGDEPILRLPAYEVRSPWELPLYLGLGLLASLMSWGLVKLMAAGRDERLQSVLNRLPPGLPTAIGGLAVGGMALAFPQVLGVGYDTVEALLGSEGGIALATLLLLIGVKLAATALSSATGFVGGGFAPALFLGAVLGNAYGQLLGAGGFGLPVAEPPAYAMVGMAAVLAGSARAPLTAMLLLFELTRDIRIVLPLMAAAGLSAALVERWQGFENTVMVSADPLEERRRESLARLSVQEAFEAAPPLVLSAATPAGTALSALVRANAHGLLVAEEERVIALVTVMDLHLALTAGSADPEQVKLADCRRRELVWLPLSASLERLEDQLVPQDIRQVPVFDLPERLGGVLPHGVPSEGLPLSALRGMASRDGMARALARRIQVQGAEGAAAAAAMSHPSG